MLEYFSDLVGCTLKEVAKKDGLEGDELVFVLDNGETHKLYHDQDCCENVFIEDICGNLDDLVGSPILQAEEATSETDPLGLSEPSLYSDRDRLWTFYKLATIKGYVTIRWYGSSNGYYSVSVSWE